MDQCDHDHCMSEIYSTWNGCSDINVSDPDAQAESGLTCADQKLIIGALEYKDKLCALPLCPTMLACNKFCLLKA